MAKTVKNTKPVLTPAEKKALAGVAKLYVQMQDQFDARSEFEDKAQEAEEIAYDLQSEAEDAARDLQDKISKRLEITAKAAAKALNKANKDASVSYVADFGDEVQFDIDDNEELYVDTYVVEKVKKPNPVADAMAVLKTAGFAVTKAR